MKGHGRRLWVAEGTLMQTVSLRPLCQRQISMVSKKWVVPIPRRNDIRRNGNRTCCAPHPGLYWPVKTRTDHGRSAAAPKRADRTSIDFP